MQAVKSAASGLSAIAQTIAVPHDHKPLRLPSFPNLERTAVTPFMGTGTLAVVGGGTRRALVCRSTTFPTWAEYVPTASGAAGTSQWLRYNFANTVELPPAIGLVTIFDRITDDISEYGESGWTIANSFQYNWPNGLDEQDRLWFYTPQGCLSAARFSFSAPITATFELDVINIGTNATGWTGENAVLTGTATAANQVNLTSLNVPGWWRPVQLRVTSGTIAAGVTLDINGSLFGYCTGGILLVPTGAWPTASLLPLTSVMEFATSKVPYQSSRCTASSLLLTNVTKVVSKEGTVAAARFNTETTPFLGFDNTTVNSVHPKERYFGALEHGFYAFTMPDQNSEKFADCVSNRQVSAFQIPLFAFHQVGYFTGIVMRDYGTAEDSTMAYTSDHHVEYRSSSTLFPLGFSTFSLEAYHGSQMSLATMGTMFENPLHLSAITSLVAAAVRKFAPIVAPTLFRGAAAAGNYVLNSAIKKFAPNMSQSGIGAQNVPRARPKGRFPAKPVPKAKKQQKRKKR